MKDQATRIVEEEINSLMEHQLPQEVLILLKNTKTLITKRIKNECADERAPHYMDLYDAAQRKEQAEQVLRDQEA